jgi:hypothetical protein
MADKIKLTNLWENYGKFLENIRVVDFGQYAALNQWPQKLSERPDKWRDFVYTVLLCFKETMFAEAFDGYTDEEILGVQWAITNKYEAIEAKVLESLRSQSYLGIRFGVNPQTEFTPMASKPGLYFESVVKQIKAEYPKVKVTVDLLGNGMNNWHSRVYVVKVGEYKFNFEATSTGRDDSMNLLRSIAAVIFEGKNLSPNSEYDTNKPLWKAASKPAMRSVPRKTATGTVGRYVREFADTDQDIMVIDGIQWQILWMKQKKEDWENLEDFAMKLKNTMTGEMLVFPNAVVMSSGTATGYSNAFKDTLYYANFFGYGSGGRGSGMERPQPPYMTDRLKEYFLGKFKAGKLEYDKYPRGTTNEKIRRDSVIN